MARQRAAMVLVATATMVLTGLSVTAGSAAPRPQPGADTGAHTGAHPGAHLAADVERLTRQAGVQLGPKHTRRPTVTLAGRRYAAPDPMLAQVPGGSRTDLFFWRQQRRLTGQARMTAREAGPSGAPASAAARAVPTPFTYREHEPMGVMGGNDGSTTSEHLADLGVDRRFQAAQVEGRLSAPPVRARRAATSEDQGSIRLATRTGVGRAQPRVVVDSKIGDGPHGRSGDGRGDFDFFRVHAFAGSAIAADTTGSRLDTVLVVYDAAGHIVAGNDDAEGDDEGEDERLTSALEFNVRTTADYYVMVGGFSEEGSVPASPFRSGSGRQAGEQGPYRLRITVRPVDRDLFGVWLHSGDVLGGSLTGSARAVQVVRTDGHGMVASQQDVSSAYPAESPLPGGGASFAYVAEQPGWYAVSARNGTGTYRLLLETYRAGSTAAGPQTVFLDFDGARMNTAPLGGQGVVSLWPMRRFLPRWGLSAGRASAVVDATVAAVTEDIDATLRAKGLNRTLSVRVLNSRDHPDPFGQPNVSRVVVGGTVRQTGIPAVGIASSIDPGNFAHEESAIVMLDELSRPKGPDHSLNTYLRPRSDKVAFIGHALGHVIAHETGHLLGSFHTDNQDRRVNLMDSGGENSARFYGVGPDRVGGTADDVDVDFGEDVFALDEGFTGLENTLNNSAWAFVGT